MRGRKPTPTHLKVVRGNPGHRPLPANEPLPARELSAAPDWLDPDELAEWNHAIEQAPRGMLRSLERDVLAVYVSALVMLRRATLAQRKLGEGKDLPFLAKTPNGMAVQSPYLGIINKQRLIVLKAAAELGFTPSARTRVDLVPYAAPKKDPIEAAITG